MMVKIIWHQIKYYIKCLTKTVQIKKAAEQQTYVTSDRGQITCVGPTHVEIAAIKKMIHNYYKSYHNEASFDEKEQQLENIIQKINEFRIEYSNLMTKPSQKLLDQIEKAVNHALKHIAYDKNSYQTILQKQNFKTT